MQEKMPNVSQDSQLYHRWTTIFVHLCYARIYNSLKIMVWHVIIVYR